MAEAWRPNNGASLAKVASKRGWPMFTVAGTTVALADNGTVYYDGLASLVELALREL